MRVDPLWVALVFVLFVFAVAWMEADMAAARQRDGR